MDSYLDIDFERKLRNDAKANVRDLIIMRIIGFQNEKYYKKNSEGYRALQDLMECIESSYGELLSDWKG